MIQSDISFLCYAGNRYLIVCFLPLWLQMLSCLEYMYHDLGLVKEFNMNPITLKRWLVKLEQRQLRTWIHFILQCKWCRSQTTFEVLQRVTSVLWQITHDYQRLQVSHWMNNSLSSSWRFKRTTVTTLSTTFAIASASVRWCMAWFTSATYRYGACSRSFEWIICQKETK